MRNGNLEYAGAQENSCLGERAVQKNVECRWGLNEEDMYEVNST